MTAPTAPGIRESVFVNGLFLQGPPQDVDIVFETAEDRRRAADGTLLVHRSSPYVGAPIRFTKAVLTLGWSDIKGVDIDAVNDLIAWGGPVEATLWRPHSEAFLLRTGQTSGVLQRKNAATQASPAPEGASVKYGAVAYQAGVDLTSTLILAAPNADYRTPWSNAAAQPGVFFVRYYGLYRLYVAEGQPSFSEGHAQGQTLRLEER